MEKAPARYSVKTNKICRTACEVVFKRVKNHLAMLAKNFKKNFLDEDNLAASYEWIRDLFQDTEKGSQLPKKKSS
ncbi:hypothetical protein TNCV_2704221 [Trichonephila clavipes]|nr:hypothetical protein TNCV_2704221 [Trichonephila clavipes]